MGFTFLLFLIAVGVGFYAIKLYNGLRRLSEGVKRAQSNLVGELRKRATLVNQLIEVCKGYGDHEKLTHITVSSAAHTEPDPGQLARATSNVLTGVNLIADRFPELKANETYRTLMEQLETIENQLQLKREALNQEVEVYNTFRAIFPAVLIAGQLGFPQAEYFSTDEAGLDAAAAFSTDDGQILRAKFAQIGHSVGTATRQIGNKAGEAIQNVRAARESGRGLAIDEARDAEEPEAGLPAPDAKR